MAIKPILILVPRNPIIKINQIINMLINVCHDSYSIQINFQRHSTAQYSVIICINPL